MKRADLEPPSGSTDTTNTDLRMVPVAVSAWLGMWLATGGRWGYVWVALGLTVAVTVLALVRRSKVSAAIAVVLAASVLIGGLRQHALAESAPRRLAKSHAVALVEFSTSADPQVSASGRFPGEQVQVRASLERLEARGQDLWLSAQVVVSASGDNAASLRTVAAGTRVRGFVRLSEPGPDDDVSAYLRVQGPLTMVRPPSLGLRTVERVRQGLRDAVAARPEEQRALVPALVLGDTSRMTDGLRTDFQTTGLTHLTAVSGANLTLLLAFLLLAARWLGVRGWWLRLVGLGGVGVFVALCRVEPSVLRAAAMGLVTLAALTVRSDGARGIRHLGVAVFCLLLVDPWLSRSVGFTLSVFASAGIIAFARVWTLRMQTWLPGPLAEAIAVPLSAQLATQPVVTAISGQVSVVGLLANALAGPLVGPATVLGFATAGLAPLWLPLARPLGWGAGWCAQGILWIAHAASRLPGATWRWPVTPQSIALLVLACLLGLVLFGELLRRCWLSIAVALALLLFLLRAPSVPGWPPREWLAVFCDVGQGDATVIRAGPRHAVVIDTGPEPAAMAHCLDQLDVRAVPLLVLTHLHADHTGGLEGVSRGRQESVVIVPDPAASGPIAEMIRQETARQGVSLAAGRPGQRLSVGRVRWTTLGPVQPPTAGAATGGENSAENDASVVGMAEVDGVRLLLTGDVEPTGQRAIVRTGADLRADILKAPHHGSSRQDETFIRDSGTGYAAVSCGLNNEYGHPAAKTVRLFEASGRTVLRTDRSGAIAFARSGARLRAVTER